MDYITTQQMVVLAMTLPSETIFSSELKSNFAFGIPIIALAINKKKDEIISEKKLIEKNQNKL